jgi:hypothetical protein
MSSPVSPPKFSSLVLAFRWSRVQISSLRQSNPIIVSEFSTKPPEKFRDDISIRSRPFLPPCQFIMHQSSYHETPDLRYHYHPTTALTIWPSALFAIITGSETVISFYI